MPASAKSSTCPPPRTAVGDDDGNSSRHLRRLLGILNPDTESRTRNWTLKPVGHSGARVTKKKRAASAAQTCHKKYAQHLFMSNLFSLLLLLFLPRLFSNSRVLPQISMGILNMIYSWNCQRFGAIIYSKEERKVRQGNEVQIFSR